jgi:hypothetical protein
MRKLDECINCVIMAPTASVVVVVSANAYFNRLGAAQQ